MKEKTVKVKVKNESLAKKVYKEASELSSQMLALLERVDRKIEELGKEGVSLF